MPRFFTKNPVDLKTGHLTLCGDDFHHIRDVLRLKTGDEAVICDGARTDLTCRIVSFSETGVNFLILSRTANRTEPCYRAVLYQGLAKGDKMDTIIQKSVELGVSRIVPVQCLRSVVRLDDRDTPKKLQRWNRIAAEAAKQCGRGIIPRVAAPLSFADAAVEAATADIRMIPWENERQCGLRDWLETRGQDLENPLISLLIGPEGGFAAEEINLAIASDIQTVSLGRRILRTETAGTAILAMLIYRFNNF